MKNTLPNEINKTQKLLNADNKQMARYLRLKLADFEAIKTGAKVLPLPSRKTIQRRIERVLDVCGLK
jgi:hypothetical protein